MEFCGLIIELLMIFGIPLLIIFLFFLLTGKLAYNERIKKIILFICSVIYNAVIGFISVYLYFGLIFLFNSIFNMKIVYIIVFFVFGIILLTINVYMMSKGKINPILYIILNSIVIILSVINGIVSMRGSIDL